MATAKTPLLDKGGSAAAAGGEGAPLVSAAAAPVKAVPYRQLFRYATPLESVALVVGLLCSVVNGAVMPLFSVIFGKVRRHAPPCCSAVHAWPRPAPHHHAGACG
jgi:hypothetical protein